MAVDSEQLRVYYESIVKHNPTNVESVHYLALWHFERQSFQQAKKFFNHLANLRRDEPDVWLCLSACYAFSDDHLESLTALNNAKKLINNSELDVRVRFCYALLAEKRRDFNTALEGYTTCLNQCNIIVNNLNTSKLKATAAAAAASAAGGTGGKETDNTHKIVFLKEIRGEILLRMAVVKKEMGDAENAMNLCALISNEQHGEAIKSNALCLKGLLHEIKGEFPNAEVVYRSVLQMVPGHCTALERLGRVYLRYRETIPAAVQCFFKAVETNPSNHIAWYLLGRCYMATSQYTDAWEAYNRAINLNPNDAQVWCSLGVLYYAFGQYREALGMLSRALKLDPTMADAWYNVGALYDMCDQPDDAQQAYLKARENGLADRFAKAGMGMNPLQHAVTANNATHTPAPAPAPAPTAAPAAAATSTTTTTGSASSSSAQTQPPGQTQTQQQVQHIPQAQPQQHQQQHGSMQQQMQQMQNAQQMQQVQQMQIQHQMEQQQLRQHQHQQHQGMVTQYPSEQQHQYMQQMAQLQQQQYNNQHQQQQLMEALHASEG